MKTFGVTLLIFAIGAGVARAQDDGKLATKEFGDHGYVQLDLGDRDVARAIAIQVDGSIVAAGFSGDDLAVVRFRPSGALDTGFGANGIVIADFGDIDGANAVAIQADGKIVVAGSSGHRGLLVRYMPDGTLDTSFDGDGIVIESNTDLDGPNYGVAIQGDGKIVVSGDGPLSPRWRVTRYLPNGGRDTSFGTRGDGRVYSYKESFDDHFAAAAQVAMQNGKIVVAGTIVKPSPAGYLLDGFAVARYLSDGRLDTTFGGDGGVATEIFRGLGQALTLRKDGTIVVGGKSLHEFAIARYQPDGALDTTFGGDGIVYTSFGSITDGIDAEINGLTVQDDGRVVAVGNKTPLCTAQPCDVNLAMARYLDDGSLDSTFDSDGKVVTDFGPPSLGEAIAYRNDRLYVEGLIDNDNDFLVAEYVADGVDGLGTIRQPVTTISCPANVSVNTDAGQCGATVSYASPTSPDAGTMTCTPASGTFFPTGSTTVTCTTVYGDGTQNQQLTASCSFLVTVTDAEPPTLTTSVAVSHVWPVDGTLVQVGFSAVANDNCALTLPVSVSVYSNEPDDDGTPGSFSPDAADIASGTLRLRAERRARGQGRVYLIVSRLTDVAGNETFAVTTATVPRSLSGLDVSAVDAAAAAAKAFALANGGTAPADYVRVGVGPMIGPK